MTRRLFPYQGIGVGASASPEATRYGLCTLIGLIFAGAGRLLKVIDDATFSAAVIMVIVTTLITPPVLKMVLARRERMTKVIG